MCACVLERVRYCGVAKTDCDLNSLNNQLEQVQATEGHPVTSQQTGIPD